MKPLSIQMKRLAAALGSAALLASCGGDGDSGTTIVINTLPAGITNITGPATYDGVTDDLLTAGLGKTGLGGAAPGFVDRDRIPTAAELRRRVIYVNYRAILDITAAGGYGTLYGPNIDINGNDTLGEGKIAGKEILAYADDGTGKQNVVVMVQIPASFDPNNACIVAAPSSGSRGVYGAIGSAGEWGLKHKCAVAYTDAGKGIGYQDLAADKVNLIDGRLVARSSVAASLVQFASDLTGVGARRVQRGVPQPRRATSTSTRSRIRRRTGARTRSTRIRFAFWALNEQYSPIDAGHRQAHADDRAGQHDRHRVVGLQRRRRIAAGAGAGHRRPDRRPRGHRAQLRSPAA